MSARASTVDRSSTYVRTYECACVCGQVRVRVRVLVCGQEGYRSRESMSALHKVFVYGTLKQGQPNHHLMLERSGGGVARLLGEAELTERYPLVVVCGIPVLLDKKGAGKVSYFLQFSTAFTAIILQIVKGELYEVDDTTLVSLDGLEEHPHLYTRTPTHCHIVTPSQSRPVNPHPVTSSSSEGALECETYIMHNCTDDALQRPHFSSYDWSEVSEDVRAFRDRTEDERAAIRKALYSLKCT